MGRMRRIPHHEGSKIVWNMLEEREKFSSKVRDEVVKLLQNHSDIEKDRQPTYEKLSTDSDDAVTYPSPNDIKLVEGWKNEETTRILTAGKNRELKINAEGNARQAGSYLDIGKKLTDNTEIKNNLKKYLIDAYIDGMENKHRRERPGIPGIKYERQPPLTAQYFAEKFFDFKESYSMLVSKEEGERRRAAAKIAATRLMKMVNDIMPESKTWLDEAAIMITVTKLTGEHMKLNFHPDDTIADVKHTIRVKEGFPRDQQSLSFADKQLEDGTMLSEYDIQNGSNLHLVIAVPDDDGGGAGAGGGKRSRTKRRTKAGKKSRKQRKRPTMKYGKRKRRRTRSRR